MADDRDDDAPLNVFDTLLSPLRLPGRVVSDIEAVASAVVALQADAKEHLSSVDDSAAKLVDGVETLQGTVDQIDARVDKLESKHIQTLIKAIGTLQESIDRIEGRVEALETMEDTITTHLQGVRSDLNERMIAVEDEVRGMRPPMEQMANDVAKIDNLLPNPSDGPLTRLKDTLSSS